MSDRDRKSLWQVEIRDQDGIVFVRAVDETVADQQLARVIRQQSQLEIDLRSRSVRTASFLVGGKRVEGIEVRYVCRARPRAESPN